MKEIDWKKQHCGVHQCSYGEMGRLMPDLIPLIDTFPDYADSFVWDVKVHMLMPGQYPCIPNWHYDNVPRVNNVQDFSKIRLDLPMYIWVSGEPLTEFRKNNKSFFIEPERWVMFHQDDEHRGTKSESFCWRGFIRATHKDIYSSNRRGHDPYRRHSQVYLDVNNFSW